MQSPRHAPQPDRQHQQHSRQVPALCRHENRPHQHLQVHQGLGTELWLRGNDAVTKTDAYELVQGVSMQTAMKYVRQAIAEGYLEEFENPGDARSRLIRMTPGLRELFNGVIDRASEAFGQAFLPKK